MSVPELRRRPVPGVAVTPPPPGAAVNIFPAAHCQHSGGKCHLIT